MAVLWRSSFGLNSATLEGTTSSGSPEILSSSNPFAGTYYLRINNTGASESIRYQFVASDQNALYYFRFNSYIVATPTANRYIFRVLNTALSGAKIGIRLTTANKLQLFNAQGGSQIGSDSIALDLRKKYRVELSVDTTTLGSTVATAKLNGLTFATGTAALSGSAIGQIAVGSDASDATLDVYYSGIAVNDTSGSSQNSWPGPAEIIYLRPSAAGDSNGFLAQIGGTAGSSNNFSRVNEVTPDDVTSYNGSAVLSAEDLFNCADSGLSSSTTINFVAIGVRMADLVSADATAAFKVELEKAASGTKTQSGTLIPNSTSWKTNSAVAPNNYPLVAYNDPDGNSWTQSTLDSMQIGYIQTATNVQTIAISNIWALVEYIPQNTNADKFMQVFD